MSRKQASAEELAMDYVGPAEEFVKILRWAQYTSPFNGAQRE